MKRRLEILAPVLLLVSCAAPQVDPTPSPAVPVPIPAMEIGSMAWARTGDIVVSVPSDPEHFLSLRLVAFDPDGSHRRDLAVPDEPDCRGVEDLFPSPLPNGRIAFVRRCATDVDGAPGFLSTLMGVDPATDVVTTLAPLRDLDAPRQVAWDPDGGSGYLGVGSRVCEGIVAVDGRGVHAIDVQITTDGKAFRLADILSETVDCASTGQADLPALSPDYRRLAFFATAGAVGKSGTDRLDVPYHLFIADRTLETDRPALSGVRDPTSMAWSPRSDQIAFAGEIDGVRAAWLLSLSSGLVSRLSSEPTDDLSWSPDGREIALLVSDLHSSRVYRIDVPPSDAD